ncbi:MAG: hypothetical protein CVV10_05005 [Gammaproteobacteria bacterium HGW-Gammaproteobacteria-14]|nr:MAG: hypothetical protein CVV10_05005 [Gammaproteobacteria bacterium HGW-Gammaproteobacteria-14]
MVSFSLPRRFYTATDVPMPARLSEISDRGNEAPPAAAGLNDENVTAIWRGMKGLYASGMTPGIALSLRRNGEHFFDRTLGYADLDSRSPMTVDTPVCLFSASKAVTAMLLHHLVEQGEVDLSQPVCHYLPEYGCAGKERTTLMHLLTHRGGVPRIREPVSPDDLFNPQRITELMQQAVPVKPGRTQAYHAVTAGFVLGAVIERVTGKPLNDLLDQVIRKPMGMRHFRFGKTDGTPATNYTTGMQLAPVDAFLKYAVGAELQEVVDVSNDPRFLDITLPAGNLYATAEEASRFFQMLLNGGSWNGKQIFRPDTVRRATTSIGRGSRIDRTLMIPLEYSPGFMLGAKTLSLYGPGTPRAFGHLGFISIYCWADPERDLSGALLTTGKGIIGPHLPALMGLQMQINRQCKR